jgi:hypothetical protein
MKKIVLLTSAVLMGTFALSACQDRDELASTEQSQVAGEPATPADPYTPPPATPMPAPTEPGDAPPPATESAPPEGTTY